MGLLKRNYEGSLSTDLLLQGCAHAEDEVGQLATWLALKLRPPSLAITRCLQRVPFLYKTPQIPATTIVTWGLKSRLARQHWEVAGIGKGAPTKPTCRRVSS